MEQTRPDLKIKFNDGKRPTGTDFADLIDSFINTRDDNIKKDANGNFIITLGNTPAGPAGTLRFVAQKVQFFDGANWQDVGAGSGGGFQPVAGTPNIAYTGGNVGVGTGATQPAAKLEVALAAGELTKIGNASVGNGTATFASAAQVSHFSHANNTNFALRQGTQGNVNLNAPASQKLVLSKGGNLPRLTITENGNVVVGSDAEFMTTPPAGGAAVPVFQVNGLAVKNDGKGTWDFISDVRLKKDIHPFLDGLTELLRINPVRYKYNGMAQTPSEPEQVGILGQEIAEVLPYTVSTVSARMNPDEAPTDDLLMFNPNALTYVLINAVKELAAKVQALEKTLIESPHGSGRPS